MPKFINLYLDRKIYWPFLLRHILYSLIWMLSILVFIFRIDYNLQYYFSSDFEWIVKIIPFFLLIIIGVVMIKTKWYYNLVLIFYPIIIIFWFFPKLVLKRGRIYLFSGYISFIFKRIKKLKRTVIQVGLFVFTVFILIISDSNIVRIFSVVIMSFFYYKFLVKYIVNSFEPARLFGVVVEDYIDDFVISPTKKLSIINTIEDDKKKDENLSDDDKKNKKLKSFMSYNIIIDTIRNNLKGFGIRRAYYISEIFQLIGFLIISILFFTFLNFELFLIDESNYLLVNNPSLFDFLHYTLKTIVFSNTDKIIPNSIIAQTFEILTFLTLGILLLILVLSAIFPLRQERIKDNIEKASNFCVCQNEAIQQHLKLKYQTDINTIINETENIKKSIKEIKDAIEKIF